MSAATLSEALSDLETELGAELFLRHKARGVTLTCEGRRILVEARRLVRHAEEFQALMDPAGTSLSGEIVVGCFPTLLPFVIPKLLACLRDRHPEVKLKFIEDTQTNLQKELLEGRLDFAIVYDINLKSDFSKHLLYNTRPYVLLSPEHRLADTTDPIDLHLLTEDPFIQIEILPGRDDHIFLSQGIRPRATYTTTNFEMVRALVARNLGYAVLVQRPIHDITYEGLPLVIRPIGNRIPPLVVVLCWPNSVHLNRRMRAFISFCEDTLRTDVSGDPS